MMDISFFHETCTNRMTGASGICISIWSCLDIAVGINMGPCGNRNNVCCKISISNDLNSDTKDSSSATYSEGHFGDNKGKERQINDSDSNSGRWKILAPYVYRNPVMLEISHDLRRPVELAPDFDLRSPVRLEGSHDLRFPVLEESSHDLRNGVAVYQSEIFSGNSLTEVSKAKPNENVESVNNDLLKIFYRSFGGNSLENAYNTCIETFSDIYSNVSSKQRYINWKETGMKLENMESLDAASNVCGLSKNKSIARMVGGKMSEYLQWPWMVSLRKRYKNKFRHICGAALLNTQWVVTAAHCVRWLTERSIVLRLGSYDLYRNDQPYSYIDLAVDRIIIHPKFNHITYLNDIALLLLKSPVDFKANIAPICLPKKVGEIEGKTAVVVGWGTVFEKRVLSRTLQEIYLPVLSNEECERMYSEIGPKEDISEEFVCAGTREGGKDACDGDSGGPMAVLDSDGRWSLIGIVSWGKVCAGPNQPGVYTRVTKYLSWMEGVMACDNGLES